MAMDAADLADLVTELLGGSLEHLDAALGELRRVLKSPDSRITEQLERSLQQHTAELVGSVGALRALDRAIDADDEAT